MNERSNNPPQFSLILRILGGGYLMYLAWDLRSSIQDGPLFVAAIVLFAVIGLVLAGHSILKLVRHEYFRDDPVPETKSQEDSEEQSHV